MAAKIQAAQKRPSHSSRPFHELTGNVARSQLVPMNPISKELGSENLPPKESAAFVPVLDHYRFISVIGKGNFGKVDPHFFGP
jgi:hypothetical protein